MTVYEVIKKPIVTEKTELLRNEFNKYTFEVNVKANKKDIKRAVKEVFGVEVVDVATMRIRPVKKRHGIKFYQTPVKKKAVVQLKAGETIKYYENA